MAVGFKDHRLIARRKIPLLVKDLVIGQVALGI
jgi:hypothetical protein